MSEELDRIAEQYLAPDATFSVDERLMGILARRAVPGLRGPRVLEMGVGAGTWSELVIRRFGASHVVDAADSLLRAAARRAGPRLTTHHSLFEDFEPDRPFDTVLASMVLEHVEHPVALLRRAAGWLAPGGRLVVIVPNARSLHRRYGVCLGLLQRETSLSESDRRIGHRRVYTPATLELHVRRAGLRVLARRPTFIKLLSNAQMSDFTEQQLEGLFDLARQVPLDQGASLFFECARRRG
jgi:trans-aconitate methyltransferase